MLWNEMNEMDFDFLLTFVDVCQICTEFELNFYVFISLVKKIFLYTGWFSLTLQYFLCVFRTSSPTNGVFYFIFCLDFHSDLEFFCWNSYFKIYLLPPCSQFSRKFSNFCCDGKLLNSTRRYSLEIFKKIEWKR